MKTKKLYRPVGLKEMELIAESKFKAFPPRLDWQPIFYPVLNQEYAEEIAYKWNKEDTFSGYCGIVTSFEIDFEYISKFKTENVGGFIHNELWIPSVELINFNQQIKGEIRIVNVFFGKEYRPSKLKDLDKKLNKFRNE